MCTIDTICYQWQANPLHIPFCAINPTQSLSSSRHHSNFPLQVIEMAKIYNEREEKGEKESARNGGNGVEQLPSSLRWELLPKHVAVIMDGNSRWARMKGLPTWAGHEAGYRSLEEMVKLSCRWGIQVLTVYAFSFENWHRPKVEVDFLMMMIEGCLKENIECFLRLQPLSLCSIFPSLLFCTRACRRSSGPDLGKSNQDLAQFFTKLNRCTCIAQFFTKLTNPITMGQKEILMQLNGHPHAVVVNCRYRFYIRFKYHSLIVPD
ncbi:uncharacterized protein [Elaeis guineensis]|uniref:uncharacterized protein isoform X2 n=1 Tax=Elaeis guineensis var. tenera TaxID=51953 RepID=UPI003C6CC966